MNCFNRVLSYLCFSVEQGKGNSSEEGAADLSNIVSLFLDGAGNDFIFFPSPYIYNKILFFNRFNDRGAHLVTVDIWEQPLSVGPYIFLCEENEE